MISAILFDLDDTIYAESDFYRSGFACVASELERRGIGRASDIRVVLESIHFSKERDNVFDRASQYFAFSKSWVSELVTLFRCHQPQIGLHRSTIDFLNRLRAKYRLGIVTDGHANVQKKKIDALGISNLVDKIVIADDFGRSYWKPSPVPFFKCCEALGVDKDDAIVVGDNPERDVLGARNAAIRCVRIRRPDGYFSAHDNAIFPQADAEITSLEELEDVLRQFNSVTFVS